MCSSMYLLIPSFWFILPPSLSPLVTVRFFPVWGSISVFFFFFNLFFYLRIISLHNFVVFCKPQHESAIGIQISLSFWTSLPSPSPSHSSQFSSVAQSCPTLCDPMNHSTPGLPVHHHLLEFTQTHVHRVSDAIQPSHPLSSPSPSAPNPSQHQSLLQWVNSSHEVAKVLEFQL